MSCLTLQNRRDVLFAIEKGDPLFSPLDCIVAILTQRRLAKISTASSEIHRYFMQAEAELFSGEKGYSQYL